MTTKIRDLMTPNPLAIPPETSVMQAARAMRDSDIGNIVVTAGDGVPVGILTDRDIVVRAVATERDLALTPVSAILTAAVATVGPDDDTDTAVELMRQSAVRRLPVVDSAGALVGILSLGDLATTGDDGSVLADISHTAPNR